MFRNLISKNFRKIATGAKPSVFTGMVATTALVGAYQFHQNQGNFNYIKFYNKHFFNQHSLAEADSGRSNYNPYQRSKNQEPIPENAVIISGTSNLELGQAVAKYLGRDLVNVENKNFADGETSIYIKDNIKGKDVYIV